MITTASISEVRKLTDEARAGGKEVGFVPTMGALHAGHTSLIRRARAECQTVVVSIFVNPTQFGVGEDLDAYPRTLEADLEACSGEGADIVFHPTPEEIYPQPLRTSVSVAGLTDRMEGARRPGHFDGVTLVCSKLFNIVGHCRAYFGQKDAQQLRVVSQMVADLNIPVDIVRCPTVREEDGLALSSRNAYLSADERKRATALITGLRAVERSISDGERDVAALVETGRRELEATDELYYLEIVDPNDLEPLHVVNGAAFVCVAARVGETRLIDNIMVEES